MRFEEQVTGLCTEALAAEDDAKAREVLGELRSVLHQHIENLRSGLLATYAPSRIPPGSIEHATQPRIAEARSVARGPRSHVKSPKWQQVVHAIAGETDAGTALQLSLKLTGLLQLQTETKSR